jgi:hypothetical protein
MATEKQSFPCPTNPASINTKNYQKLPHIEHNQFIRENAYRNAIL